MKLLPSILLLLLLGGCALPEIQDGPSPAELQAMAERLPRDPRKELGRQFFLAARNEFAFIKDPEVLALVNAIGREVVRAAGRDPDYYHFFVIRNRQINAFAVPGGYIFLHSGLLTNMKDMDALAGVIAHEIAHVERDHHFKDSRQVALADLATLAAVILGTQKGGESIDASIAIAQASNLSFKLKLSREHEEDADLFALRYLKKSSYDPRGLSDFFKKLSLHDRMNSAEAPPPYLSTHPGVIERQVMVENLTRDLPPAAGSGEKRAAHWERVVTILKALEGDGSGLDLEAGKKNEGAVERAHYLRGLYALKTGDVRSGVALYSSAIRLNPENAAYHADLALVYLHFRHMKEAAEEARRSLALSEDMATPYIVLGLAAREEKRNEEALGLFRRAEEINPYDPFVHYHLAGVYYDLGRGAQGRLQLAAYFRLNLEPEKALEQLYMGLEETREPALREEILAAARRIHLEGI